LKVSKFHPLSLLFRYAEKQAYLYCDFVVATMQNAKEHMVPSGLDERKFHHIPNGISLEDTEKVIPLPLEHQSLLDDIHGKQGFCIAYMGAHGVPNALDQFIEAMSLIHLEETKNIYAILVGDGSDKERLRKKAEKLNNVYFLDPLPKSSIQTFLKQVDCCFIGWQDKKLYHYGISANKLYDYMLSAKPIIQAVNTQYNPVIEAKNGFNVLPNCPSALAEMIVQVAHMSKEELMQLGNNGYDYVQKNNLYSVLSKKFLNLID
jgi:glycosyltransferase involved in cell wall biosynthesis